MAARRPVFVDSSGWIALFSLRDNNHAAAERLLGAAARRSVALVTTNLVAAEIHRLLLFRVGIEAAAKALDVLEGSARVAIHFATETDHREARAWMHSLRGRKITYTDAVSFAVMTSARCDGFIGFDHDFDTAGFVRWSG